MESAELPDIVYAPAHPDPRPGHRGVRFETRLLASGDPVALAFTSQPALVDALGPAQPWMALRLHRLRTLMGPGRYRSNLPGRHRAR